MNEFLLDLGFSWTWSKALPYLLCLLLGVLMFLVVKRRVKSRWGKILLGIGGLVPLGIYFAVSPIYEGDFSNNFRNVKVETSYGYTKNELTVLAIPNCPFCAGSIEHLNKIIERTNVDRINFIVITDQEDALISYRELASKEINITLVPDFERFDPVTHGRFPTFVYSDGSSLRIWSNDGFGVRAKDWLEKELTNV